MVYIRGMSRCPIVMTRGDTEVFDVEIEINGDLYTPQTGDEVRFAMRRDPSAWTCYPSFMQPLLVKTVPIDTMQLKILPEDTKALPFGRYEYDMQITFADGTVKTFIKTSPFVITREED